MTVPTNPTYSQLHEACETLAKRLGPADFIVGLSRGGLLPGVIISHLLDIPFKPLEYSSKSGAGDKICENVIPRWISDNETIKTVHLIDDIADSGNSLREVIQILTENNFRVEASVLYFKTSSVVVPHNYVYEIPPDSEWIIFPFEKVT